MRPKTTFLPGQMVRRSHDSSPRAGDVVCCGRSRAPLDRWSCRAVGKTLVATGHPGRDRIRHLVVRQPGLDRRLAAAAASCINPAGVAVLVPFLLYAAIVARGYDGVTYLRGDCNCCYLTALSLIRDGDLNLANQLDNWRGHAHQVAWSKDGRVVLKHPIFLSIVSAPIVEFGETPGALVFNLFQFGALLAVLYRLAARVAAPVPAACAVALTGVAT
jgi:hypothetical protein